jgi:hypothetical protein
VKSLFILTFLSVLPVEVLIRERLAIDALASGAVVICKVPALAHKVWNDAMENGAFVTISWLACAKSSEIF